MQNSTQLFSDNPVQKSIRVIKENAHFMKKAVESENLKEALKYTDLILSELRSESLSPKEYYTLFNLIFDELAWFHHNLSNFLKTKKKIDIFEIVQYSKKILPRLYLLIIASLIKIENNGQDPMKVFWEVFKLLKGVQHPLRGLMLRYYFLKMVKEKIEDKEDDLVIEEVISLYLMNLREMNSLWVRLNSLIDDRDKRIRQRKDLAMLVGENLMRLSALEGLDLRLYKTLVFPKVIEVILDTKDRVSQEYLFDCLISVFPDDFHLETLASLLEATERLGKKVEINAILMKLMERLALFAKNNDKGLVNPMKEDEIMPVEGETVLAQSQYHKDYIYHQFKNAIASMINKEKSPVHKLLELLSGFMNFTVFFYNGNFEFIDSILQLTRTVCEKYKLSEKLKQVREIIDDGKPDKDTLDPKCLEFLVSLLTIPMEKLSVLVLKLTEFTVLMDILPQEEQRHVSLKICAAIVNGKTQLVTEKVVLSLIQFIYPLFAHIDSKEEDLQQIVKILHFVDSGIPALNIKLLKIFEEKFQRTDRVHLKSVYPVYVNRVLFNISKAAAIQRFVGDYVHEALPLNSAPNEPVLVDEPHLSNPIKSEEFRVKFVSKFCKFKDAPYLEESDLKNFELEFQSTDFSLNLSQLLEYLHQITREIEFEHPLTSLSLWLDLMLAIDTSNPKDELDDLLYNCSNHVFSIFENEIGNSKKRVFYFYKILGFVGALKNASKLSLETIFAQLKSASALLLRREDQARAVLRMSRLYFGLGDHNHMITECIHRSLALIQMHLRFETLNSNVILEVFEYLNFYLTQNLNLFEVKDIVGCLAFIEKNLGVVKEDTEETKEVKEIMAGYFGRAKRYWSVNSGDQEVRKLLGGV